MLWVVFLAAWLGLAAALPRRSTGWVLGALGLVLGLGAVGVIAPMFIAVYLSPFAGIAVAVIAGWTRSRRATVGTGVVGATFIVGCAFVASQPAQGRPALEAFTAFTLLVLAVGAISWVLGQSARQFARGAGPHMLTRGGIRRWQSAPQVSPDGAPRRRVLPPPPRR
jgi:hypothetical protein